MKACLNLIFAKEFHFFNVRRVRQDANLQLDVEPRKILLILVAFSFYSRFDLKLAVKPYAIDICAEQFLIKFNQHMILV